MLLSRIAERWLMVILNKGKETDVIFDDAIMLLCTKSEYGDKI